MDGRRETWRAREGVEGLGKEGDALGRVGRGGEWRQVGENPTEENDQLWKK